MLIAIAALFSTGSALNATLFSAARLSNQMVADDFLPNRLRGSEGSEPTRMLILLGVLTAALVVLGSLNAISSFASLSLITIFGAVSALAFTRRESAVTALVPAIGATGATAATALLHHLYTAERGVFVTVVVLAAAVVAVEALYFERDRIESEIADIEEVI